MSHLKGCTRLYEGISYWDKSRILHTTAQSTEKKFSNTVWSHSSLLILFFFEECQSFIMRDNTKDDFDNDDDDKQLN